jgi:coenzyme Q-binding protein COQ10
MISFRTNKIVDFTAHQIFDLIMDIEKYPDFLPWIDYSKIIANENNLIIAELGVNFKGYKTSYISNITTMIEEQSNYLLENNKIYQIFIESSNGPFKKLENIYTITPLEKKCLINLDNSFEFRFKIIENLIGKILSNKVEQIITTFEERANEIYKKI